MKKLNKRTYKLFLTSCIGLIFILASCEKTESTLNIVSHDAQQMRQAYTDDGYTEVIVAEITKTECYFSEWDKTIMTPVLGLFEYYDANNNWVASIDFGDGTCDEWAIKTWDVNIFPEYPSGSEIFSVFDIKKGAKDKK